MFTCKNTNRNGNKGIMMGRKNVSTKMLRLLTTGLWTLGLTVFPVQGEAALPTHPQTSVSTAAGNSSAENAADRIYFGVRQRASSNTSVPQQKEAVSKPAQVNRSSATPATVSTSAGTRGYTEAEIRARMLRQYTRPKPVFRRVSGAVAGADYRAGTMDVKIPTLFFPPDVMQDVSETFPENPDGTFGTRSPEDKADGFLSYGAEAQKQLLEQAGRKTGTDAVKSPVQPKKPVYNSASSSRYKTITVQVPVPAPSPFRPLAKGDFYWFSNTKGHYIAVLPGSLSQNPLLQVPATGPMLIRNAGQHEFMAVTVDDPADTYYYKNQDTFPGYGKALPVFTETRKNFQGDDVNIKYIRRYVDGQQCLIVDSAAKRAGKTYRVAVIFPESKQYEYLPKALYAIENLKGI